MFCAVHRYPVSGSLKQNYLYNWLNIAENSSTTYCVSIKKAVLGWSKITFYRAPISGGLLTKAYLNHVLRAEYNGRRFRKNPLILQFGSGEPTIGCGRRTRSYSTFAQIILYPHHELDAPNYKKKKHEPVVIFITPHVCFKRCDKYSEMFYEYYKKSFGKLHVYKENNANIVEFQVLWKIGANLVIFM